MNSKSVTEALSEPLLARLTAARRCFARGSRGCIVPIKNPVVTIESNAPHRAAWAGNHKSRTKYCEYSLLRGNAHQGSAVVRGASHLYIGDTRRKPPVLRSRSQLPDTRRLFSPRGR